MKKKKVLGALLAGALTLGLLPASALALTGADLPEELRGFCEGLPAPVLPYDEASYADGSYMDQYNRFYDSLL